MTPLKLLLITDADDDVARVVGALTRGGYDVTADRIRSGAIQELRFGGAQWDLAIAVEPLAPPGPAGALAVVRDQGLDLPFIVVSTTSGEAAAQALMEAGANDVVVKDRPDQLMPAVRRELHTARLRRDRARTRARLTYLAYHDPLTDLPNRNLFGDRLGQALRGARRLKGTASLLIIDLDGFKAINDAHGHHVGDKLLQQVAARLRRRLRDSDTVARVGGDEFAVLLPMTDATGAEQAARKILSDLGQPFVVDGNAIVIRASIGASVYPEHASTGDELLQKADAAMYAAKTTRAGFVSAIGDERGLLDPLVSLVDDLRRAALERRLRHDYQPMLDLRTNAIVAVEAVLRWDHPEGRLIPDDVLRRVAEYAGVMGELAERSIEQALLDWSNPPRQEPPLAISAALSEESLRSTTLLDRVRGALEASQIEPSSLILKIAEQIMVSEPELAARRATELHDLGAQVAIDGFGIGSSSLNYLRRLPVSELRVDRSFVGALDEGDDEALVRAIIDLGHSLRLRVVADGVDTERVRDRLAALGCDAVLGHVVHPPAPAPMIVAWMRDPRPPRRGGLGPL